MVLQKSFLSLTPYPRCNRQRALCFKKLENRTIFELLKVQGVRYSTRLIQGTKK
jgi:hypothetical protein